MSRLVRQVVDEEETVLVLGGERGVVSLHVSLCGVPQVMVIHSPYPMEGLEGPTETVCRWMEGPCWYASSIRSEALRASLTAQGATGAEDDERTWAAMAAVYRLYLEGARR